MAESYLTVMDADLEHTCGLCIEIAMAERADNDADAPRGADLLEAIDKHRAEWMAEMQRTGDAYLCPDHRAPFERRLAKDIEALRAGQHEQAPLL